MRLRAWLELVLVAALWGAVYLFIEISLRELSPVPVALARVVLASLLLVPLAVHRRALQPLFRRPRAVLETVLVQATVPLLLMTFGQEYVSSALAGIIIGAQPLFVALLAIPFAASERPRGWAGAMRIGLGLVGLVLIFGIDLRGGGNLLLGGVLVLAAAGCYAVGAVMIHLRRGEQQPLGVATAAMLVTTVALIGPGFAALPPRLPSAGVLVALAVLGFVCTGLALVLFYRLIARAGPAHAALAFVEQAPAMVRRLDLRFGGILASHIGRRLLRWALPLRTASMTDHTRVRLHTALGLLACWSAWAAFDAHRYGTARQLWILALESAVIADQPDLRAHTLADVAAWHNHQTHPTDTMHLIRLAHGDERTSPPLRVILHGIHAHAYATLGEADRCTQQIKLAEDVSAAVQPDAVPGWLGGWQPGHTRAVCAQAATTLALTTGHDNHLTDASLRLTRAVDDLTTTSRHRALALTRTRLAALQLHTGNPDQAAHQLQQAQAGATDLRSARLNHALTTLQTRLESRPG